MKRVLVIGCPGSGKSCFARRLHEAVNLPLIHLDNLYWKEDRTNVPKEQFISSLKHRLDMDEWIIDGNYMSTMELRLKRCDTVFFFDLPTQQCIDGISNRVGKSRSDIPWIEAELDSEFLEFVKSFNETTRPSVIELLERSVGVNIIRFDSRSQADDYITKLKNEQ